jgi:hypothetical protein
LISLHGAVGEEQNFGIVWNKIKKIIEKLSIPGNLVIENLLLWKKKICMQYYLQMGIKNKSGAVAEKKKYRSAVKNNILEKKFIQRSIKVNTRSAARLLKKKYNKILQ